jgi:hypothetical protein
VAQLYRGLMKVNTNQNNILDGITAVVKHKDKDQAAGLELAESFILCGHQAYSGCIDISGQSVILDKLRKYFNICGCPTR